MIVEKRLLQFIQYSNWILLIVAAVFGFLLFSDDVGLGVAVGGLIVTGNFHLLTRTLRKALSPPHSASIRSVLLKYYLRFMITGIVLFFLIFYNIVNPYGLIAGLSVIVMSMTLAALNEVRQLLFKEAA